MKNGIRIFGIIIFAIVIGFTFITCDPEGDKPETTTQENEITITITGSNVQLKMKYITGGTFTMGSPDDVATVWSDSWFNNELPRRQVTLTGFYMGIFQVTQEQYEAVMGYNPSYFTTAKGRPPATGETDTKRPVETVTWFDAVEFCNKLSILANLTPYYTIEDRVPATPNEYPITSATVTVNSSANGYRLPTEAQWEYACRAGTSTWFNTGNTITNNTGWYWDNSESRTREVGKKPANAWGLFDTHGNVWEWCWDWYGVYPSDAETNPVGPASGADRVIRGGGWGDVSVNVRSAVRLIYDPDGRSSIIGFRLVRP
ncbi:MAG: formylglycine-generating enzyme family protein [Treponema sp.]|nr:formylglycine-generating enzyme family protein [Treponema sp.]